MEQLTDREMLIQMRGDMNMIAQSMKQVADTLERLEQVKFEGLDSRVSLLERFQYQVYGGFAVLGFLGFGTFIALLKLVYGR